MDFAPRLARGARAFKKTLPVALALGSACASSVEPVNVHLVTRVCESASTLDPLTNVVRLRFTVYGPGIAGFQLQTTASLNGATSQVLPNIPVGKDRDIVVEGLDASGKIVSRGETGPLDLSESTAAQNMSVFLRRVGAFTSVASSGAPTVCEKLADPRAGATATTLYDGRVLIVGGFADDGQGNRTYLSSTEIYDPRTGTLTPGPDMVVPRAFHVAVHIPGTTMTLIAGGVNGTGVIREADVFQEKTNALNTGIEMATPRMKFAAAAPLDGSAVLVAGGYGGLGTDGNPAVNPVPLDSVEVFDPQQMQFVQSGLEFYDKDPRAELTAVGLTRGRVLIVGGWDGTQVVSNTDLFVERPNSVTFDDEGNKDPTKGWNVALQLSSSSGPMGLAYPMAAPLGLDGMTSLGGDLTVLVAGGYETPQGPEPPTLYPYASNDAFVIDVDAKTVSGGPSTDERRGQGGIEALRDGTVLVMGGISGTTNNPPETSKTAAIFAASSTGEGAPVSVVPVGSEMMNDRYLGAYTTLLDGTVFACGGIEYGGSTQTFLDSAEIFQPAYSISTASPYH